MTHDELLELVNQIEEYAFYERTETGEYWTSLCNMVNQTDAMSDEFKVAYEKEVKDTLEFILENCELEIESNTKTYMTTSIRWKNE